MERGHFPNQHNHLSNILMRKENCLHMGFSQPIIRKLLHVLFKQHHGLWGGNQWIINIAIIINKKINHWITLCLVYYHIT